MTRIRTSHIVVAAVAALVAVGGSASVALAGPPPPCLSCGSGGGGGGGGSTSTGGGGGSTTTPSTTGGAGAGRDTGHPSRPRLAVTAVTTTATAPRVITVAGTSRRARSSRGSSCAADWPANCPTSTSDGVGIGGSAKRSSQVDKSAKAGGTYCYSVFTTTPYHSSAAAHHKVVVGPPAKVTARHRRTGNNDHGHLECGRGSDRLPGHRHSRTLPVARPRHGRSRSPPGKTAAVDTAAVAARPLLLRGVRHQRHEISFARGLSDGFNWVALAAATRNHRPTSSSSSMFSSSLAKVVGGVAIAVLLLAALALVVVKLINRAREDDWQYSQTSHRGGRISVGGMRAAPPS